MISPRPYDLVILLGSAGGIHASCQVLGALPADFPVPIVVVQHRFVRKQTPDLLLPMLQRCTTLHVRGAVTGDQPLPGIIYLAPAEGHLVLEPDRRFDVTDGVRLQFLRASGNPLLASAAEVLKGRVLAVVLSGRASDGTDGVQAVKAGGGTVIAQDRETAEQFGMPGSAIATGAVDYILPLPAIGPALCRLVHGQAVAGESSGNGPANGPAPA